MNVKQIAREVKSLEKQIEEATNKILANKLKLQEFMESKGLKKYDVNGTEYYSPLTVSVTERININYDVAALKAKLEKEQYNEIINKSYSINNIEGLIELLRNHGVSAGQFKSYLVVKETVNRDRINELFNIGEITLKQLKGCYTAKLTKSIQVK